MIRHYPYIDGMRMKNGIEIDVHEPAVAFDRERSRHVYVAVEHYFEKACVEFEAQNGFRSDNDFRPV